MGIFGATKDFIQGMCEIIQYGSRIIIIDKITSIFFLEAIIERCEKRIDQIKSLPEKTEAWYLNYFDGE